MPFLKEMFSPKSLIGDVRATIISMMTTGAVLFLGSAGGAIWKSVREQPVPWTFLILIGLAGIILLLAATIKLVRTDKSEQPSESNNVEQRLKQWIDAHGFTNGFIPNGIRVLIPPRFIVTIRRQKNRPSWLMLNSSIRISEQQRELFDKMPKEKKMSLFRAVRIECGRSKIDHHVHKDSQKFVCIQKQIRITDLKESLVIDSINEMHFAADVVMDTIDSLVNPPQQISVPPRDVADLTSPKPVPSDKARECLIRAAALLKDKKDGVVMNFHGLYRARAYDLESNQDLMWVCDKLVEHGYSHPFEGLNECVLQIEWLDFMKWGHLHAKWDFGRGGGYLQAAPEWSNKKGRPYDEKKVWRGVMGQVLDENRYG